MLKVQVLDRCPECAGESMVYVARETDHKGRAFDRYRPCASCHGSGLKPRWVTLHEFAMLLDDALVKTELVCPQFTGLKCPLFNVPFVHSAASILQQHLLFLCLHPGLSQ